MVSGGSEGVSGDYKGVSGGFRESRCLRSFIGCPKQFQDVSF